MKKLFYILAIGLMTGCTSTKVRRTLEDVETYISQRPDSALVVIESIDSAQLTNKGVRAHHALLHAMALDKNYIDVADDSLARTAVSYYQKHGPKKRLARSLYYLALSYFNDRQYDKAIIELIKAESVAENSDSLYMGLAKVLQANIHSVNYDKVSEIEKLFEALNIYSDIQADNYISVVRHRIARALINNRPTLELSGNYSTFNEFIDAISEEISTLLKTNLTSSNCDNYITYFSPTSIGIASMCVNATKISLQLMEQFL